MAVKNAKYSQQFALHLRKRDDCSLSDRLRIDLFIERECDNAMYPKTAGGGFSDSNR